MTFLRIFFRAVITLLYINKINKGCTCNYLPVISATFAATFSANPILVLRPVPTAVPPNKYNK